MMRVLCWHQRDKSKKAVRAVFGVTVAVYRESESGGAAGLGTCKRWSGCGEG